jgi:squalene cyclase
MATLGSAVAAQNVRKADLTANRMQATTGLEIGALQGANGEGFLYGLEPLLAMGDVPERLTDYSVASLVSAQQEDGAWHGNVPRTPIQDGDFTQTAFAVRLLAKYAPPAMKSDVARRLDNARQWLLKAKPVSTESEVMRMLGLAASGASPADIRKAAQAVLNRQRPDGGWGQRQELASDAYATGMALWALADAGQVKPSDPVYQRGVKFLVGTQADNGSWHVKSRAVIRFQPYFESGFPYEHDQWISSMGTGWATKALAIGLTGQQEPASTAARR